MAADNYQRAVARLGVGQGPSTALTTMSTPAMERARECAAREGRPFVRDELIAIVVTIKRDFPREDLVTMRVEDLRRQIRALIVDNALDKMTGAGAAALPPTATAYPPPSAPPKEDDVIFQGDPV